MKRLKPLLTSPTVEGISLSCGIFYFFIFLVFAPDVWGLSPRTHMPDLDTLLENLFRSSPDVSMDAEEELRFLTAGVRQVVHAFNAEFKSRGISQPLLEKISRFHQNLARRLSSLAFRKISNRFPGKTLNDVVIAITGSVSQEVSTPGSDFDLMVIPVDPLITQWLPQWARSNTPFVMALHETLSAMLSHVGYKSEESFLGKNLTKKVFRDVMAVSPRRVPEHKRVNLFIQVSFLKQLRFLEGNRPYFQELLPPLPADFTASLYKPPLGGGQSDFGYDKSVPFSHTILTSFKLYRDMENDFKSAIPLKSEAVTPLQNFIQWLQLRNGLDEINPWRSLLEIKRARILDAESDADTLKELFLFFLDVKWRMEALEEVPSQTSARSYNLTPALSEKISVNYEEVKQKIGLLTDLILRNRFLFLEAPTSSPLSPSQRAHTKTSA